MLLHILTICTVLDSIQHVLILPEHIDIALVNITSRETAVLDVLQITELNTKTSSDAGHGVECLHKHLSL